MKRVFLKKIENIDELVDYVNKGEKVIFGNGKEFDSSFINLKHEVVKFINNGVLFLELNTQK